MITKTKLCDLFKQANMTSVHTTIATMETLTTSYSENNNNNVQCLQDTKRNDTMPKAQSQPLNLNATTNTDMPQDPICQSENSIDNIRWNVTKSSECHYNVIEDYKMTAPQRGICLIINNVSFDIETFSKRKGSDMDAFRFKEIFRQLGFDIESKRNVSAEKMKSYFKQVAARCAAKHDALVVILLSHGSESGVYGVDGLEVDMNDILTYFDNRRCKQMMGKPKVFIVQACRGRLADQGVRDTQTFFSQPETQALTQPSQFTQANHESPRLSRWSEVDRNYHPTRTDMVLCFSCSAGYVSTRNEEEGSWLGTSLTAHLQKESYRKHLIEIFNMVSRDVRSRKSADGYKQVLEITTIGFDKNLYFNPGICDDF